MSQVEIKELLEDLIECVHTPECSIVDEEDFKKGTDQ